MIYEGDLHGSFYVWNRVLENFEFSHLIKEIMLYLSSRNYYTGWEKNETISLTKFHSEWNPEICVSYAFLNSVILIFSEIYAIPISGAMNFSMHKEARNTWRENKSSVGKRSVSDRRRHTAAVRTTLGSLIKARRASKCKRVKESVEGRVPRRGCSSSTRPVSPQINEEDAI